jgi:hypothetical protein
MPDTTTDPQPFERLADAINPLVGAQAVMGPTPLWMQNGSYGAVRDRELLASIFGPGVRSSNQLIVSPRAAGANLSVDVSGGQLVIAGTDTAGQGYYMCGAPAGIAANLAINGPPPAGQSRIDRIVARVYDTAVIGGSTNGWTIEVVEGTPAVSPTAPALPPSSLALARVTVPAALAAVVAGNIVDERTYWAGPGAVWIPYTPTWETAGAGAVQPVLGNGSVIGRYCLIAPKVCAVYILCGLGSTSDGGRMDMQFSLPFASNSGYRNVLGTYCIAGIRYFGGFSTIIGAACMPFFPTSETSTRYNRARNADATGAVGTGVPLGAGVLSFPANSQINISGVYEVL